MSVRRWALLVPMLFVACRSSRAPAAGVAAIPGYDRIASFVVEDGEVASVRLLPHGLLLVRAAPSFLAVFDSDGRQLTRIGRSGSGPGEFRQLAWASEGGPDSVWTYDVTQKRLSLFTTTGTLLQSWSIASRTFPVVMARLVNGALVLVDPAMPFPSAQRGLRPDTVTISILQLPDLEPHPVGRRPWLTIYQDPSGAPALIGQPYGARGFLSAIDTTFWYGFGNRTTLEKFNSLGRAGTALDLQLQPAPLLESERSGARLSSTRRSELAGVQDLYATIPIPADRPLFEDLMAASAGPWLALRLATDSTPGQWLIPKDSGAAYDTMPVPAGLTLYSVQGPFLTAKYVDSDGEEWVQLYRRH